MEFTKTHILDFPVEVLCEIFICLTPFEEYPFDSNDYSALFAVRWTCRAFRMISSTLPVWYNGNFSLSDIVERLLIRKHRSVNFTDIEIGTRRLLECLKEDKILLETMSRKQSWNFRTAGTLMHFSDIIPNLRTTIRGLDYDAYQNRKEPEQVSKIPTSINDALAHLGILPNLTFLEIDDEQGEVSLDQIVALCPSLRTLDFFDNACYTGSLFGLRHLEKFIFWDHRLPTHGGVSLSNLLPLCSAPSLTKLVFQTSDTPNNVFHSRLLLNFVNLHTFIVYPLCNLMCKTIASANYAHLRKFEAAVCANTNISLDNILQVLQSRCLSSLQMFSFLVEPLQSKYNKGYLEIIQTITTHLSTLEKLQLSMGINTAWCGLFSKLRKLKGLVWICDQDECVDTNDLFANPIDYETDGEFELKNMTSLVTERMKVVFEGFWEQPSVYIKILSDPVNESWDEILDGYDYDSDGAI